MLTPNQIREIGFATKGGRYDREDVDIFLSDVAADYERLQHQNSELIQKMGVLADKIEEYKRDENSIHTALVNAQRLADQMLKDAEVKAKEITDAADSHARLTTAEADQKLTTAIALATKKSDETIALANEKSDAMVKAAAETVQTQHNLFMKMKAEATAFRSGMLSAYKVHIEQLDTLTNMLEKEPTYAAEYAANKIEIDDLSQNNDVPIAETVQVEPIAAIMEEEIIENSYEIEDETAKEPIYAIADDDEYEQDDDTYNSSETSDDYAINNDSYDDYDGEDDLNDIAPEPAYETTQIAEEVPLTRRQRRAKGGFKVEVVEDNFDDDSDDDYTHAPANSGGGVFDTMRFSTDLEDDENDNLDEKSGFGFFKRRKK